MSREPVSRDENLRKSRLVFYENDIQRLNAEIDTFLELSKARCALLVDRDGHLLTRRGEPVKTAEDTISALIAGSFQGTRDSIQLQLIGERTLLATLFDGRTNLGMVRFYAQETAGRITDILEDIH